MNMTRSQDQRRRGYTRRDVWRALKVMELLPRAGNWTIERNTVQRCLWQNRCACYLCEPSLKLRIFEDCQDRVVYPRSQRLKDPCLPAAKKVCRARLQNKAMNGCFHFFVSPL